VLVELLFENFEEGFNLFLTAKPANAYHIDIACRNHHRGIVGDDSEHVEFFLLAGDLLGADLLDNSHSLIRIDNLLPDLIVHEASLNLNGE
jgi:hypothetical protein